MDGSARAYVSELGSRLSAARAAYVVGSAALGAYEPGRSDLDVLVVVDAPLTAAERERIVASCSHEALPCPARKLELVVYTASQVAAPARGQRWELNLNTGADTPLHAGADPSAEPWFWFVLDLAQAREHALALHGPPAGELIGAVSRELALEALAEAVAWYARNEPGEPAFLAAARAWRYVEEGVFSSKRDALQWACRSL
jgi:nucleotidyltransferase-like protein